MKRAIVFVLAFSGIVAVVNYLHPRWDTVVMPFRIMRLSVQTPDEVLLMPVQGVRVRRVANTWGASRPGDRKHEGQDIFAPSGTPVLSATDGIVVRIGENRLGGNIVVVVGRGGRSYYYAHLLRPAESLRIGDVVTTQSVLGYVGQTGNARSTPPHLHFGVYTAGGAVDPHLLLRDRAPLASD